MSWHPLWAKFEEYARDHGISCINKDDYEDWWDCFLSGVDAVFDKVKDQYGDCEVILEPFIARVQ